MATRVIRGLPSNVANDTEHYAAAGAQVYTNDMDFVDKAYAEICYQFVYRFLQFSYILEH